MRAAVHSRGLQKQSTGTKPSSTEEFAELTAGAFSEVPLLTCSLLVHMPNACITRKYGESKLSPHSNKESRVRFARANTMHSMTS